MKTPPYLMAAALLFWGWENGMLLWGAMLGALLEVSRLSRTRWEFSNADLNRICDLCWALFMGAALLLYSTEDRLLFVFKLAQWLPFCFFPIMLAQAYGNRPAMPLSVFWWLLRRAPASAAARRSFNISYCFFALCIMAASASTNAANGGSPGGRYFYEGVGLLIALALTGVRPHRVTKVSWVVLLLIAAMAGHFSYKQLQQMQNAMEGALGAWIANLFHPSMDPRELRTKIGLAGPIPLSGRIALRLRPEPGGFAPSLLREATWDAYKKETWTSSNSEFFITRSGINDDVKLLPTNTLSCGVEISRYYDGGAGMLDLPHGTFQLGDISALVYTNRLGMAKFDSGPGLLDIWAYFGPGPTIDSPPCDRDLAVDETEKPVLSNIVASFKLDGMKDRQKIRAIEHYFSTGFRYTLHVPRRPDRTNQPTHLGVFLTRTHAGHCEYFATATVLLLRQAGVRARYVTGYAVPETERHGGMYLIRDRDAHAWALAYNSDSGLWEQVDTTPSGRDSLTEARPSWWEPASDAMSNLYFQFSKWRWNKTSYARFSSWLLVPTILYLGGRIIFTQRRQRAAHAANAGASAPPWPGLDSELFVIDKTLAEAQLSRLPNEPLLSWQQRLERAFPDSDRLRRIFRLHRCLRFDPLGLETDDRETLRAEAQRWLAEFTARRDAEKLMARPGRARAPG